MNNYAGPGGPEFIEKQADDFINGAFSAHGAFAEMPSLKARQAIKSLVAAPYPASPARSVRNTPSAHASPMSF